jgi:hypothetical protein
MRGIQTREELVRTATIKQGFGNLLEIVFGQPSKHVRTALLHVRIDTVLGKTKLREIVSGQLYLRVRIPLSCE